MVHVVLQVLHQVFVQCVVGGEMFKRFKDLYLVKLFQVDLVHNVQDLEQYCQVLAPSVQEKEELELAQL